MVRLNLHREQKYCQDYNFNTNMMVRLRPTLVESRFQESGEGGLVLENGHPMSKEIELS